MGLVTSFVDLRHSVPALRFLSTTALIALTSAAPVGRAAIRRATQGADPEVHNIKYDGRFTFARIRYTTGPGGYYYRGLPAWARRTRQTRYRPERLMSTPGWRNGLQKPTVPPSSRPLHRRADEALVRPPVRAARIPAPP